MESAQRSTQLSHLVSDTGKVGKFRTNPVNLPALKAELREKRVSWAMTHPVAWRSASFAKQPRCGGRPLLNTKNGSRLSAELNSFFKDCFPFLI